MWFTSEVVLTAVFTLECIARFYVSESAPEYFLSYQNVLDIVSGTIFILLSVLTLLSLLSLSIVLPFYFEVVISAVTSNKLVWNYSILASYIDNSVLGNHYYYYYHHHRHNINNQ